MKRGAWHQCGFNSQKFVFPFLENGIGVGVVISPRDLSRENAIEYSEQYRGLGADVLLDLQFYDPERAPGRLGTYGIAKFRQSIRGLGALPSTEFSAITKSIETENKSMGTSGVIAPAVPYEAARPDIVELNSRLFAAAKAAGDVLGIPTYATVILGHSSTATDVVENILSSATALNADGWYYGFEVTSERLPADLETLYRYCSAGLTLACTGKPVFHAYSGPLALLSFGAGARASGLGFWQNLWGFRRERWQKTADQGGGGSAPPRFFSAALWGTIVYPDETSQLSASLLGRILTPSPYAASSATVKWAKWDSHRHLIHVISTHVTPLADGRDARRAMRQAVGRLDAATELYGSIRKEGLQLRDDSGATQPHWARAGNRMLSENADDYEYLALIGGP